MLLPLLSAVGWNALSMIASIMSKSNFIKGLPDVGRRILSTLAAIFSRVGPTDDALTAMLEHVRTIEEEQRAPTEAEWAALDARIDAAQARIDAAG